MRVDKLPSLMDLDCVRGDRSHREWTGPWGYSPLSDDAAQARQISIKFLEEARKLVVQVTSPNFKFLSAVDIIESIVLNCEIQTGHEYQLVSDVSGKVGIGRDKDHRVASCLLFTIADPWRAMGAKATALP